MLCIDHRWHLTSSDTECTISDANIGEVRIIQCTLIDSGESLLGSIPIEPQSVISNRI